MRINKALIAHRRAHQGHPQGYFALSLALLNIVKGKLTKLALSSLTILVWTLNTEQESDLKGKLSKVASKVANHSGSEAISFLATSGRAHQARPKLTLYPDFGKL